AAQPRHQVLACPAAVLPTAQDARQLLGRYAPRVAPGFTRPHGKAEEVGDACSDDLVSAAVQVQAVLAPGPRVGEGVECPQVDDLGAGAFGDRAHVHAEHGDAAAVVAQDRDPSGVVTGEDHHADARVAQLTDAPLEVLRQLIQVVARAQDVVTSGEDGDQVRPPLQRLFELFTEDVVHPAPAYAEVGVAKIRGDSAQVFGETVRETAVFAIGPA